MTLSPTANAEHVREAIRLFKVSTLEAASSGVSGVENMTPELMKEVNQAETLLKKVLPIGSRTSQRRILEDFKRRSISEFAVLKAIAIMAQRDELEYRNQRKTVLRKR